VADLRAAVKWVVIPDRRAAASPESIFTDGGYGFRIKLLYGVHYTDMCAYRAIRGDTLLALSMRELTSGWNLEMQMRVARAGLRMLELPVPYHCRIGGESKVAGNLRGSIKAGARIIATFARVAMEPTPGRAA
jgi:hypothetical protein